MKTITKPIIIYVDALRRDLLIASVIQALLKKRGFISFLVSRNTHKSCIKFIKPSLYIIVKNFLKNFEQDIINYIDKSDIFISFSSSTILAYSLMIKFFNCCLFNFIFSSKTLIQT